MSRPYRDDIDWLRAVAVLSVLAFHWDIPPFRGGYVGVDVFFVISGFLITQLIQDEMSERGFSFARFYERRARRLLPALYTMVALIVPPAFVYLLPSERHALFVSVAAAVTFTSNIFFWSQSGYFDHAANEKPLLHTWSLSVEEQFYLILPLLIWALLRWRKQTRHTGAVLPIGLGVTAVLSFVLCEALIRSGHLTSAFFNSPPRAWEFLAGSLVASERIPVLRNIHAQRVVRILGATLVLIAAISYRDNMRFPGNLALLPCAGAALYIWAGLASGTVRRAAWSPVRFAGFFGRISYSLYLWHWPLVIYARFSKPNLTLTALDKIALFAFTVAVSYASYRFIEQPLRRGSILSSQRQAFLAAGLSSAILLCASVIGLSTPGASTARERQLDAYNDYDYAPVYRYGSCFVSDPSALDGKSCLAMSSGKTNVLLWGDSLAAHYVHGLLQATDPERVNILQATVESCLPVVGTGNLLTARCRNFSDDVMTFVQDKKPELIILSGDWAGQARRFGNEAVIGELQASVAQLTALNIAVLVVGPSIEFRSGLPSMLLRAGPGHIDSLSQDDLVVPGLFNLDAEMKVAIVGQSVTGVTYLSILDSACPERRCPLILEGNIPLAWDNAHLTAAGSDYLAGFIAKSAKLPLMQEDLGNSAN